MAYRGVFGAFPYAARASDSWLFRSYALVSVLVGGGLALLFAFGLVVLVAQTAALAGGSLTLSRAFYVVVGLLLVAPVIAPTLLVARRHRREGSTRRYDAALALAGYLLVCSLYVGLVITVPPAQQQVPAGALAPVVAALYALPPAAALCPPLVGVAAICAAHRLAR
jgi:nitrate reductase gamma subunit